MKKQFGAKSAAAVLLTGVFLFCSGSVVFSRIQSAFLPPLTAAAPTEYYTTESDLSGIKRWINVTVTSFLNMKNT